MSTKLMLRKLLLPRTISTTGHKADKFNYNQEFSFSDATNTNYSDYKLVNANELEAIQTPPKGVKMLVRDFIEDSLYNPHYGYFPQRACILTAPESCFEFNKLKSSTEFEAEVARRYFVLGGADHEGPGRQLWHTPTELFKPWYGQAIAQCLVSEYLLKYYPYEDFNIYELGAGNGTLAKDILDYIRDQYPSVYDRTHYTIIEISAKLAEQQRQTLCLVHSCVQVVNKSIFRWNTRELAPCYFVAMEVIDNFAHDVIRYDLKTLEPFQCFVAIDNNSDFSTFYSKIEDPLISAFLALRSRLSHPHPLSKVFNVSVLRQVYASLPLAPNLSPPEYIPTRLLSLLQILRSQFPRHRLLLSDFSSLPDSIPGFNSPVVQTRIGATMVPCSTLFVRQGYFDVFFPTDFERLRDMYEHILSQPHNASAQSDLSRPNPLLGRTSPLSTNISPLSLGSDFFSSHLPHTRRSPIDGMASASGLPVGERKSNVFTHTEFLETYADLSKTTLRNGENPMVDYYKNVKFLF
ncbi:hypothetical protein SERLA73DRAFT_184842 [Serpula lacrymans var. lacrymans S7.3]|uniref:Protein arginine methyltransferase NDUFAF7 n=1 Tax=Serpula lacrymans var. lacrymans (strain S7.3) TaxID=936435 RepID=F8Q576_SERL3|nr:hypothetical protein SERLA73DRAFT_184842 [Serpula lacrymans var. lacrymans S7.3]